jgi:hypothetical protein
MSKHRPVYFRDAYDYGFLYVLRDGNGWRKVGYSCWPETRRRQISKQRSCELECELEYEARCWIINLRCAERHAHSLLWPNRQGHEWFDVDANTARRAVIAAITAARYDEELWVPVTRYGIEMIMTRCPDNMRRKVDLVMD